MRLTRIQAKNYRTLENIDLSFSPGYCTISGKNNAGKSCIIRLLIYLLETTDRYRPWEDFSLDYKEDVTQWVSGTPPITISYELCLTREDDPALITFVEKFTEREILTPQANLLVELEVLSDGTQTMKVSIDNELTDQQAGAEIVRKLKGSNNLFLHNSTTHRDEIYFGRGRRRAYYEIFLSLDEQKTLEDAEATITRKVKKLAREHRDELSEMLGKLAEKYDVELTSFESTYTRRMPLAINLKDKNVEVPLNDWGSGTQNRTHILMSILQANRIKMRKGSDDKITPLVIIEEPESFLHPSAQAEFGSLLQSLSTELGIQIIASTHSPYMLNQVDPSSNILLQRKVHRNTFKETEVVNTDKDQWMSPFAEHLGIVPPEFESWRNLFGTKRSKVLLVEGDTDKEYFDHLRVNFPKTLSLPPDVEVIPYGGKDALKNIMLVKFVLSKFDRVYVTFDKDAQADVKKFLERLGLVENNDFAAVGLAKPGREAVEGLLPDRVISAVNARETDLIMQLGSAKSDARNEARRKLKVAYLSEFKSHLDYSSTELTELGKLGKLISKAFL